VCDRDGWKFARTEGGNQGVSNALHNSSVLFSMV
jgi:hypothetical protein